MVGGGIFLGSSGGLPRSGGEMSGDIAMNDHVISEVEIRDYSETVTSANSGSAYTLDLANGNTHELTLTDNCALAFANPPAAGRSGGVSLILIQDAMGNRTVTWPAEVRWPNGTPPTLSTAAGAVDVLVLFTVNGGATWYGFMSGANLS